MTSSVIGGILPSLDLAEMERAKRKTENLQAYDYYLRSLAAVSRFTAEASPDALANARKSVELDPEFALGHAMIAWSIIARWSFRWTVDHAAEAAEAEQAIRRALALDSHDARVLALCGQALFVVLRRPEEALRISRKRSSSIPTLPLPGPTRAAVRIARDEPQAAIGDLERAMRLSPIDIRNWYQLTLMARAHNLCGKHEEALACAAEALRLRPNFPHTVIEQIVANTLAGRIDVARELMTRYRAIQPNDRVSSYSPAPFICFEHSEVSRGLARCGAARMTEQRRLAAIVSADVAGYSRLMGRDESGTLAALKALRQEVVDPAIARHGGRIVKTTGDGLLLEFPSVVNAVRCAVEVQTAMADRTAEIAEDRRIAFRIGINLGDIIVEGDDIFGDGVNVAARLQEIAPPGGICISSRVHEDVRDRLDTAFDDGGTQTLKNIARPVQVWRWQPGTPVPPKPAPAPTALPLPDKPSIAVLPFQNMSGDPEQEYFVDGMVEDIITALSRFKSLFVIARNSSFTYKGQAVDIRQVGRELGVRYVLEGSVRKAANRLRITGQLIDAATGATHLGGPL